MPFFDFLITKPFFRRLRGKMRRLKKGERECWTHRWLTANHQVWARFNGAQPSQNRFSLLERHLSRLEIVRDRYVPPKGSWLFSRSLWRGWCNPFSTPLDPVAQQSGPHPKGHKCAGTSVVDSTMV